MVISGFCNLEDINCEYVKDRLSEDDPISKQ